MPQSRTLSDFEGQWSITRHIVHQGAPPATFVGVARWTPCARGLAYVEEGALRIEGQTTSMTSTRRYLWKPDLSVWFDDGRYFHTVPPEGGHTSHWCDPDKYEVTYAFLSADAFNVEWQVQGPRKDYTMQSQFTRRAD